MAGIVAASATGDRRAALEALRDLVARNIAEAEPQHVAALARQLQSVLSELEALPAARKVTKVDELAAKRKNARRAAHPASAGGNVNGGA